MTMPIESQLDNLLVSQKDRILALINRGELEQAFYSLAIVADLWDACGYGYKHTEVYKRIKQAERERDNAEDDRGTTFSCVLSNEDWTTDEILAREG